MSKFFFAALSALALTACSLGTPVQVVNQSSVPLHGVKITGSGFAESIPGVLGPGEARTVVVNPVGESGLAISFNTGSRSVAQEDKGYFEGNGLYVVKVVVRADLSASVESKLPF